MKFRSITVLKPGLETCVQELPGRLGFLEQGFPVSGPFDTWSFRQANLLVGNARDTAALECQMLGPTLRFHDDTQVAVTGAAMNPTLDDEPVSMWQTLHIKAGQTLALTAAKQGMRAYIALAGGVATDPILGSRAVFHMAGVGGQALTPDQELPLGRNPYNMSDVTLRVPEKYRPIFSSNQHWIVETLAGPNDSWLSPEAIEMFFSTEWTVQPQSNRTGIRLTGPEFTFSDRATIKSSDHGQDPSNIIDHGYPVGAVNLAGQTPIILVNDSPSTGGFINPFTVASAALWKLAQTRPNESLAFTRIDLSQADELRATLEASTSETILEHL